MIINTYKKNNFYSKKGFTLIFAILISSLLVGIGIAITNLAIRQLSIASVSRESQLAFYAADAGAECALYWDIHGKTLSPVFYFSSVYDSNQTGKLYCGRSLVTNLAEVSGGNKDYFQNIFKIEYTSPSCAYVSIKKYFTGRNLIESSGINDCSANDNPYRVERSIRIEYH